ncbi:MAG: oligosaccharide flippase family protein [Nonlabens sp.]|uniref:oligosaccharide flippase family protein n=1 Tax=Nonlabens sp. TaxID=1888209 RepID=UPI003EF1AA83
MGIVIKQSGWNLAITAGGFILGALNVLLLATTYLDDEYYGLWGYVLSTAFLLFPLMSFGINNTLVKFYSKYEDKNERDAFLTQMLLWPLLIIIPAFILIYVFYDPIRLFIASKNQITSDFVWPIAIIAVFQAYFEIFYAWTKVHMKTIGGNFLKEVFYRAGATVMLVLVALDYITQIQFIYSLVLIYGLRVFIMKMVAFKTYMPQWQLGKIKASRDLINYSVLMIVAGSVGTALLDLDKFMINDYLIIDNISWYNVAVFIATVIAVPARGMAQIMHPLTAGHFNRGEMNAVENLYKRSSLNLSIIAGFLVIIIICNVNEFYELMRPEYRVGIPVVILIAIVKYAESLLGSNNAILYNSDLYRVTLWLGLLLAIVAVLLNMWLIPIYGLMGAAISTCVAYVMYAFAKAFYVYHQLKIHPWTAQTTQSIVLILVFIAVFYFWDFNCHPVVNIALKSILLCGSYILIVRKLKLSQEINELLKKYIP